MSDQTPTPEQMAAVEVVANLGSLHNLSQPERMALSEVIAALPEALTNSQPALPTEPGDVISDALHAVWVRQADGMWRHGSTGVLWSQNELLAEEHRAPFTRLVTERPQVTGSSLKAAWKAGGLHWDRLAEYVNEIGA